jgi:hypothetical protein
MRPEAPLMARRIGGVVMANVLGMVEMEGKAQLLRPWR